MSNVNLKAKRILHVVHSGALGGGPTMVRTLATANDGRAHAVCSSEDGPLLDDLSSRGIEVFDLKLSKKRQIAPASRRLAKVVVQWRPDVLMCRGQYAGTVGALALLNPIVRRTSAKLVYVGAYPSFYEDRSPLLAVRNWLVEWLSCHMAASVVCLNEGDRDEYLARRIANEAKLNVIPNGVDTDKFSPSSPPSPPDRTRIGFVGRLDSWKGASSLIDAIVQVHEMIPSDTVVELIGGGREGTRLKQQALKAEVEFGVRKGTFVFRGEQRATPDFYRSCTIVVAPSTREPFGVVALEAMACGVPVVASRVGGLANTVLDGQTGRLVDVGDVHALAEAIRQLLVDERLRSEMSLLAAMRVREIFSKGTVTSEYSKVYESVK